MIDFFWLKSFTEIIQLFLSVCFIIFLNIKYKPISIAIQWLSIFFYIKLLTDLYGILNYTPWISTILTKPVLSFFRVIMGPLELGMLTSFFIFIYSVFKKEISLKKGLPYFGLVFLLLPIGLISDYIFESYLFLVFDFVRISWIVALTYLFIYCINSKILKVFTLSMIVWNMLWIIEAVMCWQLSLITESSSWIIFVISESIFTMGIAYFFIQVVAKPKILKFEKISEIMPNALKKMIRENLDKVILEDKIYLTPNLNLTKLADKIHVSSSDLTIYLNKVLNKNFNQFVTDYRIEESKQLLHANYKNKLNVEQVMYASGFNSKSVFNTAFKNKTGMTPSQFKKEALKNIK